MTINDNDIARADERNADRDLNRDPISGTPGSHPVGVGVGGLAGGAAAGAAAGTFFGPIGTLVGAAIGVVAGAAAGKGVAERIDPTGEAAYWRDAHRDRPYVDSSKYDYDRDYSAAYGYGLQSREAENARSWEESENTMKQDWESVRGESRLSWDEARPAVQDAWNRADATHSTYARSDDYHATRFDTAPYREDGTTYADYQPAYRYGTQARSRYQDRDWDTTLESDLRQDWDRDRGNDGLTWDRAKEAVKDAFTSHDRYNNNESDRSDTDRFKVK